MSQDILHFQCMACQAPLTVPVHLAGVSGPCPKCGATVTSPPAPGPEPLAVPPMPSMAPQDLPHGATMPQQQSYPPPQEQPAASGWGGHEMPPQQQQPGAHPTPAPTPPAGYAATDTAPAPTTLPPRRLPGQAPVAGSLMNQQGLGGFGPVASGMATPSPTPQWNLPGAAEPVPMPERAIEDPMTTILRGTGAQPTSELDSDPRNLAAAAAPWSAPAPAPVSIPQQAMDVRLGGRRKGGGKVIAALAALLLVGALGAAGWYFQEPIKGLAERYFASNPASDVAEPVTVAETQEAATASDTAPFDPLAKPAQGLPVDKPMPFIVRNAAPGTGTPMPPVPGMTSPILGSTSPPMPPLTEIKPAVVPEPPAAMPPVPAAPKATIVENAPAETARKAQHIPGTALGKRAGANDALIEVTSDKPAATAPGPGSAQSTTTAGTTKEVLVQVTPEGKRAAEALQTFFAARNLSERMPLTLGSENMKSLMERYYAKKDSGAIDVDEIKLLRFDPAPETGGGPHCVFTVASKLWKHPIPVMLQEEGGAYKVDWLAFVEFRDNLLFEFLSQYQDLPAPALFHVGIRRTHYFEDDVPNLAEKDCFEIQPPLPTYVGYVFVPKNTPLASDLASRLSWETLTAYVIVELRWRRLGEMKWVELTAVPQLNWYSFPRKVQAGQPPAPKEPAQKKGSGGVDIKKVK